MANVNTKNILVIFGAADLEENWARLVLQKSTSCATGTATVGGNPVHPYNAYQADGFRLDSGDLSKVSQVIIFETSSAAAGELEVIARCDHHQEGDQGFGLPPENFWEASSLGQMCAALELSISQDKTLAAVAAADHCLPAAYAGQCPNVLKEDVLGVRLPELASRQRVSIDEARNAILASGKKLQEWEVFVSIGGQQVADFKDSEIDPWLLEAGTIAGIPFLGRVDTRPGSEKKVMLGAASSEIVSAFLGGKAASLGIFRTYGDPARGFAGGSLK